MKTYDEKIFDRIYGEEVFLPHQLNPNAVSTTRYDDSWNLIQRVDPQGSVLEIGCGIGQYTVSLARKFRHVVAVDYSEVAIERAKILVSKNFPELAPKIEFHKANAADLSQFYGADFDLVCALAVVEHVPDIFGVMDNISQVTKRSGYLNLTVPNIRYIKHIYSILKGKVPATGSESQEIIDWKEEGWDGGHVHYFTKSSVIDLVGIFGYVPESFLGDGRFAKFRRWNNFLIGNLNLIARKK
jgi:SAM-dependent methyltransferase